jgi:hypothetical protein
MIEIFKTNIDKPWKADQMVAILQVHFSDCSVSIDLEDCDRILRVEGQLLSSETIKEIVVNEGFQCSVLE